LQNSILEESRDLSLEEWNFRNLLQDHSAKLLEQQRVYWKQRGRIKWATVGDENTNFFHATATVNHNRNSIMMLKDLNGLKKFSHEEKVDIIWEASKDRLGSFKFSHMHYNLSGLLSLVPNLDQLANPFIKVEIDNIVGNLPSGKSPGPDGFNTDFMKKMLESNFTRFLWHVCWVLQHEYILTKYQWILHSTSVKKGYSNLYQ
jgi:hypothetical protein